jgi:hypothetical protein
MPKKAPPAKPVERLFPFVLRARILIIGRETLSRSKGKLHFVLITEDLSENSREAILAEFAVRQVWSGSIPLRGTQAVSAQPVGARADGVRLGRMPHF